MHRHDTNLHTLVAATPPTRDRFIDVVRAGSILVVVLGHWLMAAVVWNGQVRAENVLMILPALQPVT